MILTALPHEHNAVRSFLFDVGELEHPVGSIYDRGVFPSVDPEWDILLGEIGAGNTAAAAEAERAISHLEPDVALFVGIAGGLKDVALGDIVFGTKIYGYESGRATGEGFLPRPDVGQSTYRLEQRARAEARKHDWKQWAREQNLEDDELDRVAVLVAPIAAGEKVVASQRSQTFAFLRNQYSDAVAVEMEGRGFLGAARAHHVEAAVVRGISDLVDKKEVVDAGGWQHRAAIRAAAFAMYLLSRFAHSSRDQKPMKRVRSRSDPAPAPANNSMRRAPEVKIRLHDSAVRDCQSFGAAPDKFVEFVRAEAVRHPGLFLSTFHGWPVPSGPEQLVILSWDGSEATIERVIPRGSQYERQRQWIECLESYRDAASLGYRRSGSLDSLPSVAQEALRTYTELLRDAEPLIDPTSLPSYDMLSKLLAEARASLESDHGVVISRFEAILSSVHKVLLNFEFVPSKTSVPSLEFATSMDALVLDDDENVANALSRMLRTRGYRVDARTHPHEALESLRRVRYRVLVSDLMMPDMDGTEVLRLARALQPHLITVLVTGYGGTAERANAALVADCFFQKPCTANELVDAIERVARERQT